jgi:hypothetical protein
MALDLNASLRRPSGKPTILQLLPATDYPWPEAIALALCRTDRGTEVLGVDATGALFVLGSDK